MAEMEHREEQEISPLVLGLLAAVGMLLLLRRVAKPRPKTVVKRSNLQGMNLAENDLRAARIFFSNLRGCNLSGVNLQKANLRFSDLRGVNLVGADLTGAKLRGLNLQGANLQNVNFKNTQLTMLNLRGADLQGADLSQAQFMGKIQLPDGKPWTKKVDMQRFTDPNHPEFYRD
jgi:uncharacterized protein YjbI with pentapeptide repeats